ncbi:MAG: DUF3097 domain-containing protein [Actinomycetota bacterium]|nr:DUF3097 domain-containing protein [Actinomycetota bacterium]
MPHHPGPGILSGPIDGPWRAAVTYPELEARVGLRATHLGSRFTGVVARFDIDGGVVLRSVNTGAERVFRMHPGSFRVDGRTVTLARPHPRGTAPPAHSASGSVLGPRRPARVARAGRILVEGIHDAELVEKVWGDDLRAEGIVVQGLDGVDDLAAIVGAFAPAADARLGVLVDHLVTGSKESRIAETARGPHVMIAGTPFVDVWEAVRPSVLGIAAWPQIPKGRSWKEGVCEAFGEPVPGRLWKRILGSVSTYAELEPALVGAVESLIDFVTAGP